MTRFVPCYSRRMDRYVIGIDFGTLSARALLVNARDGSVQATAVAEYRNAVIEGSFLGSKTKLPDDTALQNPDDYLLSLVKVARKVCRDGKVSAEQIVGIGT